MYAIYMALEKQMEITLAGFDFFSGPNHHYYKSTCPTHPHRGVLESSWVNSLVKGGKVCLIS